MQDELPELKLDTSSLFREETFTDQQVGTIKRLTPVNTDGSTDPERNVEFIGHTQLMTPVGTLPLTFAIEADSLEEALAKFADAAHHALAEALEELEAMRRDAASQLIVPGSGGMGGIQMP